MALVAWPTLDPNKLIDGSVAVAAQQTDFPAYVDLSTLSTAFHNAVSPAGGDIRVFRDGTELPREIVSYVGTYQAFDGVDDIVNLASPITASGSNAWEYEAVVRKNATGLQAIIGNPSSTNYARLSATALTHRVNGVSVIFDYPASIDIGDGRFHTIVVQGDPISNEMNMFVDGLPSPDNPRTSAAGSDCDEWQKIGGYNTVFDELDIARFRIWHDQSRTNLIHDYDARNISGTTWTDAGSAGNDGTLSGSMAAPVAVNTGEMHVLVDFLSAVNDTRLDIYCDGVSADYAVDAPMGRNSTWKDYEVVAHLTEGPNTTAGGYVNSAGNSDGTGVSMAVANAAGPLSSDVAQFAASGDYITWPITWDSASKFTIQSWGKPASLAVDQRMVGFDSSMAGDDIRGAVWMDADGAGDGWRSIAQKGGVTAIAGTDSATNATLDWQLLHWTVDDGTSAAISRNGSLIESVTPSSVSLATTNNAEFWVGALNPVSGAPSGDSAFFEGGIAESRIRFDVLSPNWIDTEYKNQAFASEFWVDGNTGSTTVTSTGTLSSEASDIAATIGVGGQVTSTGVLASGAISFSATINLQRNVTSASLVAENNSATGIAEREITVTSAGLAANDSVVDGGAAAIVNVTDGSLVSGMASISGAAERVITSSGVIVSLPSSSSGTAQRTQNVTSTGSLVSRIGRINAAVSINGEVAQTSRPMSLELATYRNQ